VGPALAPPPLERPGRPRCRRTPAGSRPPRWWRTSTGRRERLRDRRAHAGAGRRLVPPPRDRLDAARPRGRPHCGSRRGAPSSTSRATGPSTSSSGGRRQQRGLVVGEPGPRHEPGTPWRRRVVKASGPTKHHDQLAGDFDGDGRADLVFWNQGARELRIARVPGRPRDPRRRVGEAGRLLLRGGGAAAARELPRLEGPPRARGAGRGRRRRRRAARHRRRGAVVPPRGRRAVERARRRRRPTSSRGRRRAASSRGSGS
jgi:hypothetical protein